MDIRRLFAPGFLALTLAFAACAAKKPPPPVEPTTTEEADAGVEEAAAPTPKSLYERLGKKEAIAKVVDDLLKSVEKDTRFKNLFAKTKGPKLDKFKASLVDFLCEKTGGDCKYSGADMKTAHKTMKITDVQWDAFVEDLKYALDGSKVGADEQKELLDILAPMKSDIVESKPPKKK